MEQGEYLYVIGIGKSEDWDAGKGSFYYIEDRNGEKALPAFTTPAAVEGYVERAINTPQAHMDMLESAGLAGASALNEGRITVMPLDAEGVARVTLMIEADYIIRDPRPGDQQETMRVPK